MQVVFRMFLRCPKAGVLKLRDRNLLLKPLYCGISRAGFVDRRYPSAGGKAVFRLFRLFHLFRLLLLL
jgi:hypothetical protein